MKKCLKITVHGKVHGVGYRAFVQKKATGLGIEGTIQNVGQTSVILYACGQAERLEDLIDNLYAGTPESKIQQVISESYPPEKNFRGVFRIIGEEE